MIFYIYCLFLVGGFTLGVFISGVTFVERFRVVGRKGMDWMDVDGREDKRRKEGFLRPTSL